MRGKVWARGMLATGALAGALMTLAERAYGQGTEQTPSQQVDLAAVGALLQKLQEQVQELHAQVSDLKAQQQSAKGESELLRKELEIAKSQLAAIAVLTNSGSPAQAVSVAPSKTSTTEERIKTLEENQQLTDSKVSEQSQTKVESGSKYRLRFTGIILLNLFENRGTVENSDFHCWPRASNPSFCPREALSEARFANRR